MYHLNLSFCYFSLLEPLWSPQGFSHPLISGLMCHFHLQLPLSHKHLILGMSNAYFHLSRVELSLISSIKLAWKTSTLLALFMAKCSDLTLLQTDIQHLVLQHHVSILVPASSVKTNWLGILPALIHAESYSNVSICPAFFFSAYVTLLPLVLIYWYKLLHSDLLSITLLYDVHKVFQFHMFSWHEGYF